MRRVGKFFIGIVRALPFVGFVRRGDRGAAHFFSLFLYIGDIGFEARQLL